MKKGAPEPDSAFVGSEPDGDASLSDTALVQKVRAGSRSAFRPLVERHSPMIFRLTRRFAREPPDAEDLAQEIFVKAYEALENFTDGTDFSAWLYTIGINHCRDYASNLRRTVDPLSRKETAHQHDGMRRTADQLTALEHTEQADRLQWALDQLPHDDAAAFLMKYEEGLRYQDLAPIFDTTVGALKVRMHRTRKKLRTILEDAP
jgi:RNA polymerase sigma-70 factor (ECF subfamily)